MVLVVAECLGSMGVEEPFFMGRFSSRNVGSGDNQSGSRPDSANTSLVTALSNTAISSAPNIEPLRNNVLYAFITDLLTSQPLCIVSLAWWCVKLKTRYFQF